MNILVINWQDIHNPHSGGAEVHLHEIFRRVAAKGHRVTLFCSQFEGAPAGETIDGIEVIREGSRNMFNFHVWPRYRRDFSKRDFDIVIDDLNKIPFYTPLYVRKPLLGIGHHFFGRSIFLEAGMAAGAYVYTAEKLVDRIYRSTPFAVVSESTRAEFVARGFPAENISIIPNCIDQERLPMRIGPKAEAPTVAYFGRLKKYKSVDHVLRAFALLRRDIPTARLEILGSGTFRDELEALAAELNIADATRFHGYVSEEDKVEQLSRAHCVVNPSMKEGWGITNVEANACGTPVISADVPGLRDSVRAGVSGLLYPYADIDALAAAMRRILMDNNLRTGLERGAVDWARRFDWNDSARRMIDLMQSVAAAHKEQQQS